MEQRPTRNVDAAATSEEKLLALKSSLADMGSVIVAYSGGADSAFLAAVANETLGRAALAVTARSPSLAPSELDGAVRVAEALGLNHRVIETAEVEREDYRANDPNRCYFCKEELYTRLAELPEALGSQIINAHNLDDAGDFRPGMNSAKRRGVRSPLVEAGITKSDVRERSRAMGLPTWDKPSQACLSSRIPYGTTVTVEALTRVAEGERFLKTLGLSNVRVRHHDAIARIEVDADDIPILLDHGARRAIVERFRAIGYAYVTLDMEGFRSGSLNETLAGMRRKRKGEADFQTE